MAFKIHHTLTPSLVSAWKMLWQQSSRAHFFNSPVWYQACIKSFGYSQTRIIAVYDHHTLVGLLPLVKIRKFGFPAFASPGEPYLDRSSLLISDSDAQFVLSEVTQAIKNLGSVYLAEVDSSLQELFSKFSLPSYQSLGSSSAYLPLSDNPFRYYSPKHFRYIQRKIFDLGSSLKLSSYTGYSDKLISTLQSIDRQSTKVREFKSIFNHQDFIRLQAALNRLNRSSLLTYILYLNSKPISYWYGFVAKDTYSGCSTSYLSEYKNSYPGIVLINLFLKDLSRRKIVTLDLSRGLSQYKTDLTPFIRPQYVVYFHSLSLVVKYWSGVNLLTKWLVSHPVLYQIIRMIKHHLC